MRLMFLLVAVGLMALAACGENYDTYLNRGGDHLDEGEYDAAIDDYNEAIRLNPDRVEAYYNRGLAYSRKGDDNSAILDLDRAIELHPDDARLYHLRGILLAMNGDYDGAISDHNRQIHLNPDDSSDSVRSHTLLSGQQGRQVPLWQDGSRLLCARPERC